MSFNHHQLYPCCFLYLLYHIPSIYSNLLFWRSNVILPSGGIKSWHRQVKWIRGTVVKDSDCWSRVMSSSESSPTSGRALFFPFPGVYSAIDLSMYVLSLHALEGTQSRQSWPGNWLWPLDLAISRPSSSLTWRDSYNYVMLWSWNVLKWPWKSKQLTSLPTHQWLTLLKKSTTIIVTLHTYTVTLYRNNIILYTP